MFAGLSVSAAGRSRYEVPVIPIAMLRESYAVGSGFALAGAGMSTAAARQAVISLCFMSGPFGRFETAGKATLLEF
jgi:hypothetical protein